MSHMRDTLLIFAKRPIPGLVKTRLTGSLTREEAAELYRCMLLDTLAKTGSLVDMDSFIFYEPSADAAPYFREIAGEMAIIPQEGKDLGERMANAFEEAFARGYAKAAIIGTDSPDLPVSFITLAFEKMDDADVDVVCGPSEDGGYYLVAMKRLRGEFFRGIPWSSGEVLRESLSRAAEAGIAVSLLPPWHDVDTIEDLQRPELLDDGNGAPLTRSFIQDRLRSRLRFRKTP